jgi:hypothetical protein
VATNEAMGAPIARNGAATVKAVAHSSTAGAATANAERRASGAWRVRVA